MKWKAADPKPPKQKPKHGDTKIKHIFLLWPFKYGGYWYWLEWVDMEYMYTYEIVPLLGQYGLAWFKFRITNKQQNG